MLSTPIPAITINILRASYLLFPPHSTYLSHLNALINDTYETHGHPSRHTPQKAGPLFTDLRITTPTSLIDELGPSGLIAICTDVTTSHPDYGSIIATAALKPFKGKTVTLFLRALEDIKSHATSNPDAEETAESAQDAHMLNDLALARATSKFTDDEIDEYARTENWEITTCAVVNDSRFRGTGLAGKCIDGLVGEVMRRRDERCLGGGDGGRKPIKLWSTALGGSGNAEYWIRRGFVAEGGVERAPVGLWSAIREVEILTLGKVVG